MVRIEVYDNGVHSLSTGLRAFAKFHDEPTSRYDLKDAILRIHHGLETLFKLRLLLSNPVYVFPDHYKVENFVKNVQVDVGPLPGVMFGDQLTGIQGEKTIGLFEALDRLQALFGSSFASQQQFHHIEDAAKDLIEYRNRLQHLGLEADEAPARWSTRPLSATRG